MTSYLRRKGDLIEGILIPFTTPDKDRYRTYWNRQTDFGLDVFAPHPVLYLHGMRSAERQGTLVAFELRDEGLYARAELNPQSMLYDLIDSGRAAWSSAALPHLIEQDLVTGYIRKWVLLEGSIGERSQVAAADGLTSAAYVRTLEADYGPVRRSLWVGNDMSQAASAPAAAPPADEGQKLEDTGQRLSPGAAVQAAEVGGLGNALQNVHAPATSAQEDALDRALLKALERPSVQNALGAFFRTEMDKQPAPAERTLPAEGAKKSPLDSPSIRVSSRYDPISLLGMVWHDELQSSMRAFDRHWDYDRDEEFMRALLDKMGKAWKAEEKVQDAHVTFGNDVLDVVPMRSVMSSSYNAWHQRVPYLRAGEAMTSTLAGFGDELVPQLFSSVVYYHVRLAAVVSPLFQNFLMPGNPYEVPKITSGPSFHHVNELTDADNLNPGSFLTPTSKIGTDKVIFDAGKLAALTETSRELIEDSGINFSQAMANEYVREMGHTMDWALLNGDEDDTQTNISYYGTKPSTATGADAAYSRALALNGLRSIVDSGDRVDLGTLESNDILNLAKTMGPRGIIGRDLRNLTMIMGPETQYKLEELDDYEGMDKVGNLATLVNGQLGSWRGVPIVVSEDMLLGTAGGNHSATAASNTLGICALVHRPSILIGMRRMPQIEQVRIPGADASYITASMRLDVQAMETGAVAVGYNVTV